MSTGPLIRKPSGRRGSEQSSVGVQGVGARRRLTRTAALPAAPHEGLLDEQGCLLPRVSPLAVSEGF